MIGKAESLLLRAEEMHSARTELFMQLAMLWLQAAQLMPEVIGGANADS